MTDKGNNIFDIEVPDGAKYVIFNNGDSQTDDLRIADGNKIYSNGSWQNYSTVKPTQPTTAPSTTVRPLQSQTQPITTQPTTSPACYNTACYNTAVYNSAGNRAFKQNSYR